ncbi:MAG: hypothetical protein Q7K41_01340, partial [Dehalococcoidales bacterium]|nr:hypothetical protein [Dehalococcoidales bacterium]
KKIGDIKSVADLAGYDGYIFGSPTFSLDLPKPVRTFLLLAQKVKLEGKMGGAFGSYRHDISYQHDSYGPAILFKILEEEQKMKPFELGPFNLKEDDVETRDGLKACQDYGKVFGEKLS